MGSDLRTIFGGNFESTRNPETRRTGEMHYTFPENIHKVSDPLFLDDLKAELQAIGDTKGLTTPRQRTNCYRAFHEKLYSLRFLETLGVIGYKIASVLRLRLRGFKLDSEGLDKGGLDYEAF